MSGNGRAPFPHDEQDEQNSSNSTSSDSEAFPCTSCAFLRPSHDVIEALEENLRTAGRLGQVRYALGSSNVCSDALSLTLCSSPSFFSSFKSLVGV